MNVAFGAFMAGVVVWVFASMAFGNGALSAALGVIAGIVTGWRLMVSA